MTFDEIRMELANIAREEACSPAETRLIDVVDELAIAAQTQSVRIQELALNQVGVNVPIGGSGE